jgi:hypothetical protein
MYNYFPEIVLSIALSYLLVSCDLATTRDAEEPEQRRTSYEVATTPEQLFTNLRNSFSEKVEKDYESSFVDSSFLDLSYLFTPSSESIFIYSILTEWDLDAEKAYFKNLINAINENDIIILSLELLSFSVDGNSGSYNYNYSISLPAIDESTSLVYAGNAFFRVNLDANNQWVITEWIDTKTGNNPSWSELKGRFY